jgi:hypothetical protein
MLEAGHRLVPASLRDHEQVASEHLRLGGELELACGE